MRFRLITQSVICLTRHRPRRYSRLVTISDELHRDGYLDGFRSINNTFLIALDGTDFFSSEKISCPCCTQSKQKNGKTLNRPIAVSPVGSHPSRKTWWR